MENSQNNPRFLIIDSYDSFTNNLAALVEKAIPDSSILIIKNDEIDVDQFIHCLPYFHAVIVGPGPGSPAIPSDVGLGSKLWGLADDVQVPALGVCLGHQSLGITFDATLRRLNVVKHGQVSCITHIEDELFRGIPQQAAVVRYHSLCVDLCNSSKLVELAWANDYGENGRVVMALKHRTRPFYGVQYHPESICTDGSGIQLIRNFWRIVLAWNLKNGRQIRAWNGTAEKQFSQNGWPSPYTMETCHSRFSPQYVVFSKLSLPQLCVPQICEILGVYKVSTDFVLLDSAATPGSYAIIGCIHPNSIKVQYHVGSEFVTLIHGKRQTTCALGSSDVWTWLESFMRTKEAVGGDPSVPFWGGFIGYLSYELGVEALLKGNPPNDGTNNRLPDVNLIFIERSLVVHSKTGEVILQSLLPRDDDWFAFTASALKRAATGEEVARRSPSLGRSSSASRAEIVYPDKSEYISKIKQAKECLLAGESYELCLTAPTRLLVPKSAIPASHSSWEVYKRLRSSNPAPYAAYLRLYPATLVSSSPERFLSYSRSPLQRFQLRPIKGTVRKGHNMTRERAEEILSSPKEIGENLMIVDLIRHDLHGVIGPGVEVKKFCGIEEYETVWQLVSVIEAPSWPSAGVGEDFCPKDTQLGWKVLQNSLPPGSMTGAPKKRSVQILRDLEGAERRIYSGVMGYWCVSGAGDWSVVIRSCFKHDDTTTPKQTPRNEDADNDEWFVGAGGAITALSDPEAEWDEMLTKLRSVLGAFRTDD